MGEDKEEENDDDGDEEMEDLTEENKQGSGIFMSQNLYFN